MSNIFAKLDFEGGSSRSDVSCRCEIGENIAICGIIGPIESKYGGGGGGRSDAIALSSAERCNVEVYFKVPSTSFINNKASSSPFTVPISPTAFEQEFISIAKSLIEASIQTNLFPRTVLSVTLRILGESSVGGGITCCFLSLSAALLDSGIPLNGIPILLEVCFKKETNTVSFVGDDDFTSCDLLVAFANEESKNPIIVKCQTLFAVSSLNLCVEKAKAKADQVRKFLFSQIQTKIEANNDFFVDLQ